MEHIHIVKKADRIKQATFILVNSSYIYGAFSHICLFGEDEHLCPYVNIEVICPGRKSA